jgi:hypothetical protein
MALQVGRQCRALVVMGRGLPDTRRRFSVLLGLARCYKSSWRLLIISGDQSDRAAFGGIHGDLRCLFSGYPRFRNTLLG